MAITPSPMTSADIAAAGGDTTVRNAVRKSTFASLSEAVKSGRARYAAYAGSNWTTAPVAVTAGGSNTVGQGMRVKPGWRFYMTSLTFSADGDCNVEMNFSPDEGTWATGISNTSSPSSLSYAVGAFAVAIGANGGSATIPFAGGYLMGENSLAVIRYKTAGTVARRVSYVISGYEVPGDMHPDAAIPLVVLGDSISAGGNLGNDASGRAYLGKWNWHAKFVSLARTAGKDVGLHGLYAEDGKTLEEMAYHLVRGMYPSDWAVMIVALGMNDAALSNYTSTAQLQGWMQEIIDYRDRNFPGEGRKIVFCGPSSTDETGRTTANRIGNVRSAIQDKVASAGGTSKNLMYVDWSQAFPLANDPTTDLNNKASERTAGTRVHPSGIGSSVIGQYTFDQTKSFLFGL
jgi:hypothetical protein